MDPIGTAGTGGTTTATPLCVFLSHTSDLGNDTEPASFVAAAVGVGRACPTMNQRSMVRL
jgi:hypothetical protein